jgi:hypothetical protein
MISADDIRTQISDPRFLEAVFNKEVDWDAELDARDADNFADAWNASYDKVHASGLAENQVIEEIRESAYKQTYRITQNPDLAGYVSDDFGLMAMAFEHKIDLAFIHTLWDFYVKGAFPR